MSMTDKKRNVFILALLITTLAACTFFGRGTPEAASVSLPLTQTAAAPADPLEVFRQQRDASALQNIAALQALVDQERLDAQTRQEAAIQLQAIIDAREKQTALEGALLQSGFSPCVAVVSMGCVTIVTQKETLSDAESALLLTQARRHAGANPASVQVITEK